MQNKTLDLAPMKWVQEKHELMIRNQKAERYSASVRNKTRKTRKPLLSDDTKETIEMFVCGLGIFVLLFEMYFIGVLLS